MKSKRISTILAAVLTMMVVTLPMPLKTCSKWNGTSTDSVQSTNINA